MSARVLAMLGAVLWSIGQGAASAPQRESPVSSGITGVVVTDAGAPARQAMVTLSGAGGAAGRPALTDDQGRFSFDGLRAGTYFLAASKPGFLDATYGQRQPGSGGGGTPIELGGSGRADGLVLRLWRGGAVSGMVVDDRGDAAYPVAVTALRRAMRGGRRVAEETQTVLTDDRGVYRIGVLLPGEYFIRARPLMTSATFVASGAARGMVPTYQLPVPGGVPTAPLLATATVYYPGTIVPDEAGRITIAAGAERSSTDITLQAGVAQTVKGAVTMADGRHVSRARVYVVDRGDLLGGGPPQECPVAHDGTFETMPLPPGRYAVVARAALAPASEEGAVATAQAGAVDGGWFANAHADLLWAEADVTVGAVNISDVVLALRRGSTVSGTVTFAGGLPREPERMTVSLTQIGFSGQNVTMVVPSPVAVDAAGRFQIAGVPPGEYWWTIHAPPGWWPRSMLIDGRDTLDAPLEIRPGRDVPGAVLTVRDQAAEISGTLEDTNGHPTAGYMIVLFPTAPDTWLPESRRIRAMQTGTGGTFAFDQLPAGAYALAAVTDVESDAWFDPAFLQTIAAKAVHVDLADGEKKIQSLQIAK